jgi:hypothetical protein
VSASSGASNPFEELERADDYLTQFEIVHGGYPISGASTWYPHGYRLASNVLDRAAEALTAAGYVELVLPTLIPLTEFARQGEIKDFLDRVYLVGDHSAPDFVIKPTIEAQVSRIFRAWSATAEPPFRVFTRRSVGRYEGGKTSPLWKERVVWPFVEAHAALASQADVQDEIEGLVAATDAFARQCALPLLTVERLKTNKRLTEYAHRRLEAVTIMPSGKVSALSSIYDLGDRFSRVYGVCAPTGRFSPMVNFGFSGRLILAMLAHNAREALPVHPPSVAPIQLAAISETFADVNTARSFVAHWRANGIRATTIETRGPSKARTLRAKELGVPLLATVHQNKISLEPRLSVRTAANPDLTPQTALRQLQAELETENRSRHDRQIVRMTELANVSAVVAAGQVALAPLCSDEKCQTAARPDGSAYDIVGALLSDDVPSGACASCNSPATQEVLLGVKYHREK